MYNIVSLIVTFNRKLLLEECIQSLLNQSYNISKILIIDNASSDGTEEMLINKGYIKLAKIKYIKLPNNIGGAGGFYEGIKYINENINYDWIWLMDDDTIPKYDALEKLVESMKILYKENIGFLCSKVISENNLMMNVPSISKNKDISNYYIWPKYLEHGIVEIDNATFVSILINKNAIKKIGYPFKEFFIWGDDTEYTLRITKYFGKGYLIGNSHAVHKRIITKAISIVEEDDIKRIKFFMFSYRNNLIISKYYYSYRHLLKIFLISIKDSIKCLLVAKNNKFFKFLIIQKSILQYLFDFKFHKLFKNRMNL